MNIGCRLFAAVGAGIVALGLLTLSACSGQAAGGTAGKLDVVASFYPMQFLAQRIGGSHVSVSDLTKPGAEPHDLEISPRQTADLSKADLVVYLRGLQPSVDEAVGQAQPRHVAEVGSYTTQEDHGTEVDGTRPGRQKPATNPATADPHVWLDPVRYAQVAKGLGAALRKADPKHAASYRRNTRTLVRQLDALDRDYRAGLEHLASKTFVTTHAAFGYLAERYGLREEAVDGVDPDSEPSPARMTQLHKIAEKDHVRTVFSETIASPKTAETLAGDLKLKTDVLDPLEGITDKSRGHDYLQVMRANLKALRKALGAT